MPTADVKCILHQNGAPVAQCNYQVLYLDKTQNSAKCVVYKVRLFFPTNEKMDIAVPFSFVPLNNLEGG